MSTAPSTPPPGAVFLPPAAVADLLGRPDVRLLEVRRDPADAPSAHLPEAVVVDLAADLADPAAAPTEGRRPLPDPAVLQRTLRRWGLAEDTTVVAYDAHAGLVAARAWWVLRWAGLTRVALLEGGLDAWRREGRPTGDPADDVAVGEVPAGDVVVRPGHLPQVDTADAGRLAGEQRLLDARDGAAYRKGHVPGARSVPSSRALDDTGRLRPATELRALYGLEEPGAPVPALSCGGGVAGAFGVAVLAQLGIEAPLHVGSFSAWSADPARPVATGDAPGTATTDDGDVHHRAGSPS